jgi:hypothetical protein
VRDDSSQEGEEAYAAKLEDLVPRNRGFDSLYHDSMASF